MDELNPYAAPIESAAPPSPQAEAFQGLWRDGRTLIMHKNARLPHRCVKTGEPTTSRGIIKRFSWYNPWLVLVILLNLLIFIVLAIVLSKRATIEVPLSDNEKGKRSIWLIGCWVAGLGGMTEIFFGIYLLGGANAGPAGLVAIVTGIILILAALIVGQAKSRVLRPTKITDTHIWLRGVHESILSELPSLPPGV